MTAKKAATSAKHKTATKKHAASAKHTETKAQLAHLHTLHVEHVAHLAHLTAIGKPATPAKATKKVAFAVGDWLPVCGFEAVAQSARLAGARVHGDDVAELWHLFGGPEATAIEDALAAAARFGLAGAVPQTVECSAQLLRGENHVGHSMIDDALCDIIGKRRLDKEVHGLILRIDVPGPHAVLATRDGWWSWGELHSPWPCRVSEAWAVSWP